MSGSVLYDVQGPRARRRVLISSVLGGLLVLLLLYLAARRLQVNGQFEAVKYQPFFDDPRLVQRLGEGLQNTLLAAAYSLVFALVLGVVLAFGRLSHRWFVRVPSVAIIEFFRAMPLLVLIFALFLAAPIVVNVNLPALWALVIALTLYNGSVIAEIIRAGVLSIPKGQTEAALAMGLTRGQNLRLVLLPQAVRVMLPALVSQLVVLLKDTSLGFVIGFEELLRVGGQLREFYNNPLQMYVAVALIYIAINSCLSALASYLEGRQRRTTAVAAPVAPAEAGAVL